MRFTVDCLGVKPNCSLADPIEDNSCQALHGTERRVTPCSCYTPGCHPSSSRSNDNAPFPVGRDDPRVPNGTQQNVQPQKDGGFSRLEHLGVDAAPSMSFPTSQLVHRPPSFLWCGWITAYWVSASWTALASPGNSRSGDPHDTTPQSSQSIGPDLRFPRQFRVSDSLVSFDSPISLFYCRTAGRGPRGTQCSDFSVGRSRVS